MVLLVIPALTMYIFRHEYGHLSADDFFGTSFFAICGIAAYGALVFPIRYFSRGLRLVRAAKFYLASSITLYLFCFLVLVGLSVVEGRWRDDYTGVLLAAGIGWAVLGVIAFIIYGVMHFIRSMRASEAMWKKSDFGDEAELATTRAKLVAAASFRT